MKPRNNKCVTDGRCGKLLGISIDTSESNNLRIAVNNRAVWMVVRIARDATSLSRPDFEVCLRMHVYLPSRTVQARQQRGGHTGVTTRAIKDRANYSNDGVILSHDLANSHGKWRPIINEFVVTFPSQNLDFIVWCHSQNCIDCGDGHSSAL
jgi:hypothetical protein